MPVPTHLGTLPERVVIDLSENAQRFLDAAVQSATSTLAAFDLVRGQRRKPDGKLPKGRLTDGEEDQLRAVVIFAGAGLDAVLKQLLRDMIFVMTHADASANDKLNAFTVRYLSEGELGVNPKRLARLLLTPGLSLPRESIIEEYIRELTGDSLQSVSQVQNTCGALALNDPSLRKRIKQGSKLDQMFRARNEMIHELDLVRDKQPTPGNRAKRVRRIEESIGWATEALSVAQEIVNSAANKIRVARAEQA